MFKIRKCSHLKVIRVNLYDVVRIEKPAINKSLAIGSIIKTYRGFEKSVQSRQDRASAYTRERAELPTLFRSSIRLVLAQDFACT